MNSSRPIKCDAPCCGILYVDINLLRIRRGLQRAKKYIATHECEWKDRACDGRNYLEIADDFDYNIGHLAYDARRLSQMGYVD